MKRIRSNYAFLLALFVSVSASTNENLQNNTVKESDGLNLVCKPKERNFDPMILSGFSINNTYNYDEVRIWYAGSVSEFIPVEIRTSKNGIEVMKGKMIGHRGRSSYVEFKSSSKLVYDIYTTKNQWNCVSNI